MSNLCTSGHFFLSTLLLQTRAWIYSSSENTHDWRERERKEDILEKNTEPEPTGRACVGIESLKKSKIICASFWNALNSAVGNSVTLYLIVHLLFIFDQYFHVAVWVCLDGSVPSIFIKLILMDTWNKNYIYISDTYHVRFWYMCILYNVQMFVSSNISFLFKCLTHQTFINSIFFVFVVGFFFTQGLI